MIQINKRFSVTSDSMNWVLLENTPDAKKPTKSFFNRPEQCFSEIISRIAKDAQGLTELINDIYVVRDEIISVSAGLKK